MEPRSGEQPSPPSLGRGTGGRGSGEHAGDPRPRQEFRRPRSAQGRQLRGAGRQHLRPDRAQRRRQDHGVQSRHRLAARLGIARTFQNIRVFRQMTLLQNVMVGMHHLVDYGPAALFFASRACRDAERRARQRAYELLSWVKLEDQAEMLADSLSYGDQRKLEFARALATEPKLLLLDEPVAGMNPAEKSVLMDEIRGIRDRGYGVFLIEHDMRFVMGLCERIAVLNFGRIIAEGAPDAIRSNPDVIEAYLGRENDQ